MDSETLTASIEAILLTANGPVTVAALVEALDDKDVGAEQVNNAVASMVDAWDRPDSGIRLEKVADGWRCFTPASLDSYLWSYHGIAARQRLSQAALEVLAIVFFLQAAFKTPDPRESALRILRRRSFVIGYFVLGLAVPFALMLFVYRSAAAFDGRYIIAVELGSILGLMGGLILRQSVLACGALPTLNIGGFEFRRIARPKEPKPEIGLLPPT